MVKDDTLIMLGALGLGAAILYKPLQKTGGAVADTVGGVATGVQGLGSGLSTAAGGLGSGISQVGTAGGHIAGEVGETVSTFLDVPQAINTEAAQTITGVSNAVQQTGSDAYNVVRDAAGNIIGWVRNIFNQNDTQETGNKNEYNAATAQTGDRVRYNPSEAVTESPEVFSHRISEITQTSHENPFQQIFESTQNNSASEGSNSRPPRNTNTNDASRIGAEGLLNDNSSYDIPIGQGGVIRGRR